jgi:intracellular septation protein A
MHWALYFASVRSPFAQYACRLNSPGIAYGKNYSSLGLYIFLNMCTVLSPCGFIATVSCLLFNLGMANLETIQVYVLLGRLSRHLHAEEYLLIKPTIITKLYVVSKCGQILFVS